MRATLDARWDGPGQIIDSGAVQGLAAGPGGAVQPCGVQGDLGWSCCLCGQAVLRAHRGALTRCRAGVRSPTRRGGARHSRSAALA